MKRLDSIQYVRAIAALIVVVHHIFTPRPGLYDGFARFGAGTKGVGIFFVMSGYILYSATRNEELSVFMKRRAIRIAPFYWFATLMTLAYEVLFSGLSVSRHLVVHVFKSLLFWPHYNFQHIGQIWPFLVPGWTLQFEAFFYVVFALGILSGRLVLTLSLLLPALVALGLAIKPHTAVAITYTSPLLLEFLGGVLIAHWGKPLTRPWAAWLWPVGMVALVGCAMTPVPEFLADAGPAILIVIGIIAIEHAGRLPKVWFLRVLGQASYSIYLFQVIAVDLAARIVLRLPIQGPWQMLLMTVLGLGLTIAIGLAIFHFLERPLTRRLTGRHRSTVAITARLGAGGA